MSEGQIPWPPIADDDPRREVAEHWAKGEWKQLLAELDNDDHLAAVFRMPLKPSKAVLEAGEDAHDDCIDTSCDSDGPYTTVLPIAVLNVYQAMIAAAYPDEFQ